MTDTNITNGDLQELLRSNPMAAQQLEAISARRERDEALAYSLCMSYQKVHHEAELMLLYR